MVYVGLQGGYWGHVNLKYVQGPQEWVSKMTKLYKALDGGYFMLDEVTISVWEKLMFRVRGSPQLACMILLRIGLMSMLAFQKSQLMSLLACHCTLTAVGGEGLVVGWVHYINLWFS